MEGASNLYYFNPTCEYAVANGNASWQPNRLLQKMESDLDTLPMFFGQANDYVLVNTIPSVEFQDSLKQLNFKLPNFIEWQKALSDSTFQHKKWERILPWGWSPAAHKRMQPFKNNSSVEFKASPIFEWKPQYGNFYSKKFGLNILRSLLKKFPKDVYIDFEYTAKIVMQKTEFELLLKKWGRLMVKAPWSSSGRGLQPVTKTPVHEKVWEKLLGIINEQGYAIVEPYLNKVLDIAFQFEILHGKVRFLGISNFTTDSKGQYLGNHLNGLPPGVPTDVKLFVENHTSDIIESLILVIGKSSLIKNYEGNFGVDALIYRNNNDILKINPCLEINLRQNMGLLALQLEKLLAPGRKGMYKMWFNPGTFFCEFNSEMQKKYPLVIRNGKIESGYLAITDARYDSIFGAYVLV